MDCVAQTVYYEARGEGENGMRAVAHVIYNRAKNSGKSPCIIVREPNQFVRGRVVKDKRGWEVAKRIASNPGSDLTNGATYFHNLTVRPRWSYNLKVTYKWGNHIFYRR